MKQKWVLWRFVRFIASVVTHILSGTDLCEHISSFWWLGWQGTGWKIVNIKQNSNVLCILADYLLCSPKWTEVKQILSWQYQNSSSSNYPWTDFHWVHRVQLNLCARAIHSALHKVQHTLCSCARWNQMGGILVYKSGLARFWVHHRKTSKWRLWLDKLWWNRGFHPSLWGYWIPSKYF